MPAPEPSLLVLERLLLVVAMRVLPRVATAVGTSTAVDSFCSPPKILAVSTGVGTSVSAVLVLSIKKGHASVEGESLLSLSKTPFSSICSLPLLFNLLEEDSRNFCKPSSYRFRALKVQSHRHKNWYYLSGWSQMCSINNGPNDPSLRPLSASQAAMAARLS